MRGGIPKKGQAQTFLRKKGNMECVKGKVRKMFKLILRGR